jgi:hypothetical protein
MFPDVRGEGELHPADELLSGWTGAGPSHPPTPQGQLWQPHGPGGRQRCRGRYFVCATVPKWRESFHIAVTTPAKPCRDGYENSVLLGEKLTGVLYATAILRAASPTRA